MNRGIILRTSMCIFACGLWLYSYIEKQNTLTDLRIRIPELSRSVKTIQEENTRLQYEIDQFENPEHLIELARHAEFAHLKHPLHKEILTCNEGIAIQTFPENKKQPLPQKSKATLATRAK